MSNVGKVLLLRHAQSVWNAEGRWQGWADPPLSPLGEEQTAAVAERLQDFQFQKVLASDLQRAQQTAAIIADALSLHEVVVHDALRERDVGEWTGLTNDEIDEKFPEVKELRASGQRLRPPGSEAHDFDERALQTVKELVASSSPSEPIIAVTHGGFIRAVERLIDESVSQRVPNLAGRWIIANGDTIALGDVFSVEDVLTTDDETDTSQPL